MVNPINAIPAGLPTDLINIELGGAMPAPTRVDGAQRPADTGTATTGQQHDRDPSGSSTPLDRTLEQINDSMRAWSTGMRFELDEDAQRMVVSIVDSESGEVLRTVPSDAVLRVAKMIVQLQGGAINVRT